MLGLELFVGGLLSLQLRVLSQEEPAVVTPKIGRSVSKSCRFGPVGPCTKHCTFNHLYRASIYTDRTSRIYVLAGINNDTTRFLCSPFRIIKKCPKLGLLSLLHTILVFVLGPSSQKRTPLLWLPCN